MKKSVILAAACLTTVSVFYSSCKKSTTTTPTPAATTPPGPTLYSRVGGTAMVNDPKHTGTMIEQGRLTLRSVVDSSINVIAADAQLQPYFGALFAELGAGNTSGLTALSQNFTDFMCTATGSTNAAYGYGGKSMKDAHNPAYNNRISMKVNAADFDKFVGDIGTGLAKNGVNSTNNAQLVNDLVALLETTKADIVQR
ncbi:MAG TPA: group 1 truncated hemoglobin [Bacteroidia bacterium]|jgi:hypothetical protein|nr:group 1 truncated hemoglobin [Bacteroidia bacterium]